MPIPNKTGASKVNIARRREIVADYISRGKESYSIITEALVSQGLINPDTNEPYTEALICQDKRFIREQWAQRMSDRYEILVGDVVQKQLKVFELSLENGDYKSANDSIAAMRQVMDLDKPKGTRALKRAADERSRNGEPGMSEFEAERQAIMLDSSPAVLGEMLQIMAANNVFDAALITETTGSKLADEMLEGLSDSSPAMNGHSSNGNR